MQHLVEEICRLELWDKEKVSAAAKTLLWSIEQPPYSIQANAAICCCRPVSRCQSESSSHGGYLSSDGGDSPPRSNAQQLHYPSHAHMDPGDVLLVLPSAVTQLEDIIRTCDKEMLLQAFSDSSDAFSRASYRTFNSPLIHTSGSPRGCLVSCLRFAELLVVSSIADLLVVLSMIYDHDRLGVAVLELMQRFFCEPDIPGPLLESTRISMDASEHTEELIKMLKINTRVLCLMKEQLCEQSRPFEELKIGYFAQFAKCPIKKLLEIALCLSKTVWPATHISRMLLAYEALADVLPFIQKLPSSESDDFFFNIECNMREAFRGLTDRIKDHMRSNTGKHPDVAFHPMTCFLICSVRYFSSHSNLLQSTLGPSENSNSFGHLLGEVIACWKSVLTEHSKEHCTDLPWQYIFLLNNTEHFNKKTDGLLDGLLSDSQIIEHNDKFNSLFEDWIKGYTDEACSPANSCLTRRYWWGSRRPSLVAFTSKFNKSFDRQRTWKVPDTALRGKLQRRIQDRLLPDYTRSVESCSSSGLFCSVLQIGSTRDIYTPECLEKTVQGLFEG